MEVKLGVGIDCLKFGMKQNQIEEILGKPDKIKLDSDESDRLILEYNSQNLRLIIYLNEESKLGYISTTNLLISFEGKKIIGQEVSNVIDKVFNNVVVNWEIDEYDYWKTYGEDRYWITLNVEYEKVKEFELGVILSDQDDYVWPK